MVRVAMKRKLISHTLYLSISTPTAWLSTGFWWLGIKGDTPENSQSTDVATMDMALRTDGHILANADAWNCATRAFRADLVLAVISIYLTFNYQIFRAWPLGFTSWGRIGHCKAIFSWNRSAYSFRGRGTPWIRWLKHRTGWQSARWGYLS